MNGEQVPAVNARAEEPDSARIDRGIEYPGRCQANGQAGLVFNFTASRALVFRPR